MGLRPAVVFHSPLLVIVSAPRYQPVSPSGSHGFYHPQRQQQLPYLQDYVSRLTVTGPLQRLKGGNVKWHPDRWKALCDLQHPGRSRPGGSDGSNGRLRRTCCGKLCVPTAVAVRCENCLRTSS
jgi:hypothetical protein